MAVTLPLLARRTKSKFEVMAYTDTRLKPDDIPLGDSCFVELGELPVGLYRTAEGVFALNNICPHRGAPLNDGFMKDDHVTCPWHQWQFNIKDGKCRNIPGARVAAYPVEVRDGTIWIDLEQQREGTP
jgi:NAD(P)H-dependent nitrite reductase small subunit